MCVYAVCKDCVGLQLEWYSSTLLPAMFIDRAAGEIIRLVASVCVCIRLSVGTLLFEPFDV